MHTTTIISNKEQRRYLTISFGDHPLVPFCMKEFEHCSNNEQVIFNNMLRSARNPIECAFGRLKA